jgi:hypothetical protein
MAKKEYDATDIQPVVPYGHDGTEHRRLKVDSSGKISVGESALPSGAATAAKQLPDGHAVTANAGTNLNTSALATSANQLPDGHNVTSNRQSLTDAGWENCQQGEYAMHVCLQEVNATTGYVFIKKSDTTNYPHTVDGDIYITGYQISINPTDNFFGTVYIGFISRIDETDAYFRPVFCYFNTRKSEAITDSASFICDPIKLNVDKFLVAGNANDATFKSNVALTSPAGTSLPAVGDCVGKIIRTTGDVSVGITLKYYTKA